jgi:tetratricopeptide (TPR) repeat protein
MTLDLCPYLTSESIAEPCLGCRVKSSLVKQKVHKLLMNSCLSQISDNLKSVDSGPRRTDIILLEIYKLKRVTTLEDDEGQLNEPIKKKAKVLMVHFDSFKPKIKGEEKVQFDLDYGGVLFNLGQYKKAEGLFTKISKSHPKEKRAWNNIGVALVRNKREREAIRFYDRALALDPTYGSAWFNKGKALFKQGQEKKALECFEKATKYSPDNQSAWNNLGVTLRHMKKFKESIKCYERAIKIHPNYPWAWHNKGVVLMELKRYKQAMRCFDKALQIDPRYRPAMDSKREVLRKIM